MIKVMHFCSDSNVGGAGKTLYRILSHSDKNKFLHTVVLPSDSKLVKMFSRLGLNVILYYEKADNTFSLPLIFEFKNIINRNSPHIVHTHGLVAARIAACICGVRSRIYTRHTYSDKTTNILANKINSVITTKAVAVNPALIKQINKSGIENKKIRLIENGCESLKMEHLCNDSTFSILYHGRIEKSKGLALALRALYRLKKKGHNLHLTFLGDGKYKSELIELCSRLNINNSVSFLPFTDDVGRYVNLADVVINCSYNAEGTSNSIIEGMSAGKVCVVSSVEGNINVITQGIDGLVFKRGCFVDLADNIEKIINDKALYNTLSTGALSSYNARFTVERMLMRYEDLWEEEYRKQYE